MKDKLESNEKSLERAASKFVIKRLREEDNINTHAYERTFMAFCHEQGTSVPDAYHSVQKALVMHQGKQFKILSKELPQAVFEWFGSWAAMAATGGYGYGISNAIYIVRHLLRSRKNNAPISEGKRFRKLRQYAAHYSPTPVVYIHMAAVVRTSRLLRMHREMGLAHEIISER